ncbi:hypothetical protein Emed_007231 [Eimeria media]
MTILLRRLFALGLLLSLLNSCGNVLGAEMEETSKLHMSATETSNSKGVSRSSSRIPLTLLTTLSVALFISFIMLQCYRSALPRQKTTLRARRLAEEEGTDDDQCKIVSFASCALRTQVAARVAEL